MTIDELIRMTETITKLLSVIIWPSLFVYFLIRFGPDLKDFFKGAAEFSFKGAGFEATVRRKQNEIVASLVAAKAAKLEASDENRIGGAEIKGIADFISSSVSTRTLRRTSNAQILWVDDHPENNINERQALESLGVSFTISTSTNDAIELLSFNTFDLIISDMGRPPDPQAGYTLLDKIRAQGNQTPYIIYAGSRAPEHRAESRRRGAITCTNQPDELFDLVLMALEKKKGAGTSSNQI